MKIPGKWMFTSALLVCHTLICSAQDARKEVNYIRGLREEENKTIVELGKIPRICFLSVEDKQQYIKLLATLRTVKKGETINSDRLFELGIYPDGRISYARALTKQEQEKHHNLLPKQDVAVAAVDNGQPAAFYKKAEALFEEEKFEQAVTTLNKAISINTQNPDFHRLKALSLSRLERYEEAIREAAFALRMDQANSQLYGIIANGYYFMGELEKAVEQYEIAVQYDRGYSSLVFHNYIRCLIEMPRPERALEVYRVYLFRTGRDWEEDLLSDSYSADLAFYAGQAFQQLRQWSKALDIYNALIVVEPEFYGYMAQRARLYLAQGACVKALADFRTAMQLAPAPEQARLCEEAAAAYDTCLQQSPQSADSLGLRCGSGQ